MPKPLLATVLARALLAGGQEIGSIVSRVKSAVGRRGLPGIAKRYQATFAQRPHPRQREVVEFLLRDAGFRRLQNKAVSFQRLLTGPQQMLPAPAAAKWEIPALTSTGELCDWLRLLPEELEWFADLKGMARRPGVPMLHHYYYKFVVKRNGDLRLIEAPKQRLKQLQRQILVGILDAIPAHPAAQGFIGGRSIRSFAAPHVGKRVVLRMDLQDFFPSIRAARVQAMFRTAGYPEAVASLLAGICTNAVPGSIWRSQQIVIDAEKLLHYRSLYGERHLPQGAPTSPALANLCAYRTDCRLQGLAKSADAEYTRYADDLAFSGGEAFDRRAERFADHVGAILLEEGFRTHYRKTRVMRQGVRQQLAGLVINQNLNLARDDFDRLKAMLTNCIRHGAESQNRDGHPDFRAHLAGRVGFVESIHAVKGARLRRIFDRISW